MKVKTGCSATGLADESVWPPGFRFHPTDEELVLYYLKRKICGRKIKLDIIGETDVYKWDPEELPGLSLLKTGDRQWFFFSPRDRKYPNGARSNRATRHGYWKATGKDRNVRCNSRNVGVKKTLVFYNGRAPSGERTDWDMHEYTLDEDELKRCQNVQEYYALYKVYKKSGPGPKNGEQYGAPFKEEDWAEDHFQDIIENFDGREIQVPNEITSVADNRENVGALSSLDDIEEFMKQIVDDPLLDFPEVNDLSHPLPEVVCQEETESTLVDLYSQDLIFPQPISVTGTIGQQCDNTQVSFGFTQLATSQLQTQEASEVTYAPDFSEPNTNILIEEGFLEIDDLIGPEPTSSNINKPVENNLRFEETDGLSGFDQFYDANMFLSDSWPINHETVPELYINEGENNNVTDQLEYQFQANPGIANGINGQIWMPDEVKNEIGSQVWVSSDEARNVFTTSESRTEFFSTPTSGVLYESSNLPTGTDQANKSGTGATSSFSSALWAFVESIPTTPASASENTHRALERMSSFSRMRLNSKIIIVATCGTETRSKGRNRGLFFVLSIVGALCAILWVLMGNVRLWGRCISL